MPSQDHVPDSRRPARWRSLMWGMPALFLVLAQVRAVLGQFNDAVLATLDGGDAVLQSGILTWTTRYFWDPALCVQLPIFYPAQNALVCMDTLLGQALGVFPFYHALGLGPAALYNLSVVQTLLLTAASGALLWWVVADEQPRSFRAAGAGFCALALLGSPFTAWQLGMLNQISPPWVVVLLACLWGGWRRFEAGRDARRWWWAAALCLPAQAAWGWYGFAGATFVAGTAGGVGLVLAARARRLRALLVPMVLPLVAAAALVAALAWPYLQLRAQTPEYTREIEAVQHYGSHLHVLGNAGAHRLGLDDLRGTAAPVAERAMRNTDAVMHPGYVASLCALAGVWGWRRMAPGMKRFGVLVTAVGVVGFVMSFGDSGGYPPGSGQRLTLPFGVLRDLVMPYKAFRCPSRFIFLTNIAVAWWAAAGLYGLSTLAPGRVRTAVLVLVWGLLWVESVPMAMHAAPVPASAQVAAESVAAGQALGAMLVVPAPVDESDETVWDAYWLLRALATGRPATDGMSGWVPPVSRQLRRRLVDCEQGRHRVPALLDSLRSEGIVAVELAEDHGRPGRSAFWRAALGSAGLQAQRSAPGYLYYRLDGLVDDGHEGVDPYQRQ